MASRIAGFRLGIYVFKDAEIVDFAAPHGVFSVARRFDPELDAFLIADANRPVQAQAGFTVLPNYSFSDEPAMDAFLIPGGFGTRQEMHNRALHAFIRSLPETTLLTSVCTGSWVYGVMGLLDGLPATNRKEPDRVESGPNGKVPLDRLAQAGIPTLVVSGDWGGATDSTRDTAGRACTAVCDVLEQRLAAQRAVIQGAGHAVPFTGKPFNERLAAFLASSSGT